ncbi:hypothetical protein RB195_000537 [Necator americanus]|uniref:Uncharacterized protein n=1 Tax=Necator americanus TaxID=51031 RepID=A0ABR1DD89_NECAM
MRPSISLVILLFVNLSAIARKLTTEENIQNSLKCGVHFLGNEDPSEKRLSKKSYGGRKLMKNEYPWTVHLVNKSEFPLRIPADREVLEK